MKTLLISIDLVLGTRILIPLLKEKGFGAHNLQIVNIRYSDHLSEKAREDIYNLCRGYDVVGIAFNSFYAVIAKELGLFLKSKGIRYLLAGGPHPTAMPEEVLKYADISVIYEAEVTLPKVLSAILHNKPLNDIKGIAFKDGAGRITETGCPAIVESLDAIPFQTSSSKDITYYDLKNNRFGKPTLDTIFPHGGRNYFILTSRGCPFRCAYCCNNLFSKLDKNFVEIRKRGISNVIAEMDMAKRAGYKGFYIADDNFFAFTLREIEEFSRKYRARIRLPFGISGLNPNNMRSKDAVHKLGLLLDCGLSDIRIGAQSGNDKTLKIFNRRYTSKELPGLLKPFEDRRTIWPRPNDKLRIAVDFICDAPWEDEEDKISTLILANNLLTTYGVFFYTLIYLPGTDIYELAVRKRWIRNRERDIYLRGIAGVDDTIHNRLFFLIAVLHERGGKIPDEVIPIILKLDKEDPRLSRSIIDSMIKTVNDIETHHSFKEEHLTLHPYLKGFNKWVKVSGHKGKKVLFRSYHTPYG